MKKVFLIAILCCSFLLTSCNLKSPNDIYDTQVDDFQITKKQTQTEKQRYVVDYFDFNTYDIVEELGKEYIIMSYNGGSNLCYSGIEFVLGQIYNFSGREMPLRVIVKEDIQLDNGLFKCMTYPELSDLLGDSVNEPEFYEDMMEGSCSYKCSFDYNGYSYVFEWQCDYKDQIEYSDRECDVVTIYGNETEPSQYEDCLFDYGSCESAKSKINLTELGYDGCKIVQPESNEFVFINNEKYYVFYIYGEDGTGSRHLMDVFASSYSDVLYLGNYYSNSEPVFSSCYKDLELKDFSNDDFSYYGTTEQNCYRYYTKDF